MRNHNIQPNRNWCKALSKRPHQHVGRCLPHHGALIAATRRRPQERFYILLVAGLLTLLVGLSRIALGVHWTTNVIGGWAFGSAWAVVWLQVARTFVKR